jgi:hypothetical protein
MPILIVQKSSRVHKTTENFLVIICVFFENHCLLLNMQNYGNILQYNMYCLII